MRKGEITRFEQLRNIYVSLIEKFKDTKDTETFIELLKSYCEGLEIARSSKLHPAGCWADDLTNILGGSPVGLLREIKEVNETVINILVEYADKLASIDFGHYGRRREYAIEALAEINFFLLQHSQGQAKTDTYRKVILEHMIKELEIAVRVTWDDGNYFKPWGCPSLRFDLKDELETSNPWFGFRWSCGLLERLKRYISYLQEQSISIECPPVIGESESKLKEIFATFLADDKREGKSSEWALGHTNAEQFEDYCRVLIESFDYEHESMVGSYAFPEKRSLKFNF